MKKRILIVERDTHLNKVNEKILNASGIVEDLRITLSGSDALTYLKSCIVNKHTLPHIIIFDLQMPDLTGFEFIDRLSLLDFPKEHKMELVVFTASSNPSDKQKAFSKGIRHYFAKPYLLRSLRDVVFQMNCKTPAAL